MRTLQTLRGGKLIWRRSSPGLFDISIQPATAWPIHHVTVQKLIDNNWIKLKEFNVREGEYSLSETGIALTDLLCRCSPAKTEVTDFVLLSGVDPSATKKHDWKKERLLCGACWRVARCAYVTRPRPGVVRSGPSHAANRWYWKFGPVCVGHCC
jgi:hypothetical protein